MHPGTLKRWIREDRGSAKKTGASLGHPLTPLNRQRLILRMARDNQWGYTRIIGVLKKLRFTPPLSNTVKAILRRAGFELSPNRGDGRWDDFLKQHATSLWQYDFVSRRVLTYRGFREAFVLAFIHVSTRRVIYTQATYEISASWIEEQANDFVKVARSDRLPVTRVMRDSDNVYRKVFDETLRRKRVNVKRLPFRVPKTNAFIKRFVQTIKRECLDHFLVFGLPHFDLPCHEYLKYYHHDRPHKGKKSEVLLAPTTLKQFQPVKLSRPR